jgi:hypothetical protein
VTDILDTRLQPHLCLSLGHQTALPTLTETYHDPPFILTLPIACSQPCSGTVKPGLPSWSGTVPSTRTLCPVQSAMARPLPFRDGFSSGFSAFSSLFSLLHRHHHPHTPPSGDHSAVQTFVCVLSLTIKSQPQSLQASAIPRSFQITYSKFYHNVFHQIHYRCGGFTLPNCFFHRHI